MCFLYYLGGNEALASRLIWPGDAHAAVERSNPLYVTWRFLLLSLAHPAWAFM
jgi:hypothetical protein